MPDLASQLFSADSMTVIACLIALGYLLRGFEWFPNKYIGVTVTLASLNFSLLMLSKPWPDALALGLVYAAFSSLAYEQVIKFVTGWIKNKIPTQGESEETK